MALNPFTAAVLTFLFQSYGLPPKDLDQVYVDPASLVRPHGQQPNLIHIYLESTEFTLFNTEVMGQMAAPLVPLLTQGFAATGIQRPN